MKIFCTMFLTFCVFMGQAWGQDIDTLTAADLYDLSSVDDANDDVAAIMSAYIDGPVIYCIGDPEMCAEMIAEHEATLKPSQSDIRSILERCLEFIKPYQFSGGDFFLKPLIDGQYLKYAGDGKYEWVTKEGEQLRRDIEEMLQKLSTCE